jgi:hypothetical protein
MVSDDLTAVRMAATGGVEVVPGTAQLHLTEDAAAGLGVDLDGVALQPWRRMKAAVATDDRMAATAQPVRGVVHLSVDNGDDVRVRRLEGTAKFQRLQSLLYGPVLAEEHEGVFPAASVLASLDLFEVARPEHRWSAGEVADVILRRVT